LAGALMLLASAHAAVHTAHPVWWLSLAALAIVAGSFRINFASVSANIRNSCRRRTQNGLPTGLAWERTHEAAYTLKVAEIEHELGEGSAISAPPHMRARLDAIEREKLDLYQRRYQEYVRVSKALQALES
jgi:hypothetical protein